MSIDPSVVFGAISTASIVGTGLVGLGLWVGKQLALISKEIQAAKDHIQLQIRDHEMLDDERFRKLENAMLRREFITTGVITPPLIDGDR